MEDPKIGGDQSSGCGQAYGCINKIHGALLCNWDEVMEDVEGGRKSGQCLLACSFLISHLPPRLSAWKPWWGISWRSRNPWTSAWTVFQRRTDNSALKVKQMKWWLLLSSQLQEVVEAMKTNGRAVGNDLVELNKRCDCQRKEINFLKDQE